jgi:hypothetical protein
MWTQLGEAYGWLQPPEEQWAGLKGYTHSGLEQLGMRFRDDGNIAPHYQSQRLTYIPTIGYFTLG